MKLDDILHTRFFQKKLFIKIDVEGGEHRVLKGMQSLLKNQKPLLLVEIWRGQFDPGGENPHYKQTFELLFSLGYKVMTMDEKEVDHSFLNNQKTELGYNFLGIPG